MKPKTWKLLEKKPAQETPAVLRMFQNLPTFQKSKVAGK